jgi:DNA-binding XRE family transcriptional regulator
MDRDQIIAAKVHKRTARPTLTLTGLAHQVGVTRPVLYSRLEKGGWKYDELERLARALGLTIDQLITENHTSVGDAP